MPNKIVLQIRRSELHTLRASFWPWERPILDFIHKGNIKDVGEESTDQRILDPVNEFERLERRYGFDKETHIVRVHAVYGAPPLGINKLEEVMRSHLEEQAENDARKAEAEDAEAIARETNGAEPPPSETEAEQPQRRRRASS